MAIVDHLTLYDFYRDLCKCGKVERLSLSSSLTYGGSPKKYTNFDIHIKNYRCGKLVGVATRSFPLKQGKRYSGGDIFLGIEILF
jgi:hypothetical protein